MMTMIMLLFGLVTEPRPVAKFQPCVWPNPCASEVRIAQFQPCVWPNRCSANV